MTPRTALVVEDDAAIRALITAALTGEGCRVLEAPDGQTALATASDARPDVVLLDIGLPDIDGLTVLHTLKNDAELREIPVVMVTAWADTDMVRQAMDRGAADYVCKPFAIDDLVARVEASMEQAPAAEAGPVNDPVTGLPGRDHLATVLERQAVAARRTGRTFAVVLADLDDPQAIEGDELRDDVLRAAAKRLRQRADVSDLIVRYDDHGFAIVLPGSDAGAARDRAEQLRGELAGAALDTPTAAIGVTASFGVAAHEPPEHADDTLARAVDALCTAMAGGGDSVHADGV
jgi:two-component system KDP operon response regulator KdpE